MRIVFAGTPKTAIPTLEALIDSRHEVVAVVTRPAARVGRGRVQTPSPVELRARELGVDVITHRPTTPEFAVDLEKRAPDCCAVVAYGALLPTSVLSIPRYGWVNLHFSLLPQWRGAAPVQFAIIHGDDVTGATTFQIEPTLDTGPIFGVVTETIHDTDTSGDVLERLSLSGAGLMVATMDGIDSGALVPAPQGADGVSYAPKLESADARVDWRKPAIAIDRLIRGCTPEPGAWTMLADVRIGLGPVTIVDDVLPAGEIRVSKRDVIVGTGSSAVRLGEVRPPGKKPMPAQDWARGTRAMTAFE